MPGPLENSGIILHQLGLNCKGHIGAMGLAVFFHTLSTCATVHAYAMQPRGVWGGSPFTISLRLPTPCASISWISGHRDDRAYAGSPYTRRWALTNGPISHPHTVPR
jgi:hypothetical protein